MSNWGDPRLPQRFWDKVSPEPNSGCWLWTAQIDKDGYGCYHHAQRFCRSHRIAYAALVGEIPEGLVIDHLCSNPACANPDHLEPVTQQENIQRGNTGKFWAARRKAKTHCTKGHLLSPDNVFYYKHSPTNSQYKNGIAQCRACQTERSRKLRKKNKMNTYTILDARIVSAPRVIDMKDGEKLTTVRCADNPISLKKDADPKDKRRARFVTLKAWGKQGEMIAKLSAKDVISVSGELGVEAYTKDGEERTDDVMRVTSFKVQKSESFYGGEQSADEDRPAETSKRKSPF